MCVCVCVRVCARVCVRACRACVLVRDAVYLFTAGSNIYFNYEEHQKRRAEHLVGRFFLFAGPWPLY